MALDLTSFNHAMKTLWPEGPAVEVMRESPMLALMEKNTKFDGRNLVIDVIRANNMARSATYLKARANGGHTEGDAFTITRKRNYAFVNIDRETMLASRTNKGALVSALDVEGTSAIQTFKNDFSADLFGDGTGKRGVIASISTNTLTLTSADDTIYFDKGQKIELSDSAQGATRTGVLTVAGVNRDTGVLTFTTAVTTGIAAAVAGDIVYNEGDFKQKPTGLAGWLPAVAPTGGDSFFGVDRSSDPSRLAGIRYDASTLNHEEAVIKASARFFRDGARPKDWVWNPQDVAALELILGSRKSYEDVEGPATIGFTALKVATPYGTAKIFSDPYCPKGTGFALTMKTWTLNSLGEAPQWVGLTPGAEDGTKFERDTTADGILMQLASYSQFSCNDPGQNGRIKLAAI